MPPAAVVLVLAVVVPGQPTETHAYPLPTEEACTAAQKEWLRPHRGGDGRPLGAVSRLPSNAIRYAHCVPLQAYGNDL